MRTEVRIRFDSSDIPGGAATILGPALCGPDVATVKDVPVLRQIVVWVTLEANDPRLVVLVQLLKRHAEGWLEIRKDYYTDEELGAARLIIMQPQNDYVVFGGPRVGTQYNMGNACSTCGAGAHQTSAMLIESEARAALEGLHAASTFYSDILVDDSLAEELGNVAPIGLSFRSVYAVMEDKRQVKLRWRQLCAAHTLPPISSRSTGIERRDACTSCGRSGFFTKMDDPPRIVYRAQDLDRAEDVNTTWEWFGDWKFNGNVSEALFAYPWFLVTPKVWRVFRDAGALNSFNWMPVRVEDGSA